MYGNTVVTMVTLASRENVFKVAYLLHSASTVHCAPPKELPVHGGHNPSHCLSDPGGGGGRSLGADPGWPTNHVSAMQGFAVRKTGSSSWGLGGGYCGSGVGKQTISPRVSGYCFLVNEYLLASTARKHSICSRYHFPPWHIFRSLSPPAVPAHRRLTPSAQPDTLPKRRPPQ